MTVYRCLAVISFEDIRLPEVCALWAYDGTAKSSLDDKQAIYNTEPKSTLIFRGDDRMTKGIVRLRGAEGVCCSATTLVKL